MQKNTLMRLSILLTGMVLLFSACKPGQKIWTHDEEWANPEFKGTRDFHGTVVKSRGNTLLCKVCHGTSLQGTAEVRGCYRCHFGPAGSRTPSGPPWEHGLFEHDKQSLEEPVCTTCHELYRSYGLKPGPCHDCHAITPEQHPSGKSFLDKKSSEFHGRSTLVCSSCHDLKSKCSTCHFDASGSKSPSGSNWTHGTTPHKGLAASEAVCNTCHDLNRNYGNGPATCHDCHGKPPGHVAGEPWLNPKSAQFHGKSMLDCSSCHDTNKTCSQCHFGKAGMKSPPSSGWIHGTIPHKELASSEAVCNQCHTLERSYGNGPAACHDCHDIQPGHVLGKPWLDPKSSQFHGQSTLTCSTCHDLKSKCSTCHFGATGSKSPVNAGWAHGTTPHNQLASSEAVCNKCHTLDRSYGNGPAACHDCHGQQTHVLGDSWLNPKSSNFHGKSTLDCSSCHNTATECSSCHFGATGSKIPAGSSWAHGTTPHNQLASSEAVCNRCHELDRRYGNGPATCHDCHAQQSHVTGKPWLDPKSSQFHGNSSLSCSSCHNTSTECSTCHFGASGSKSPSGSGWSHGSSSHKSMESYQAVCNRCHTLERSYGNGPSSCHDCHGDGD